MNSPVKRPVSPFKDSKKIIMEFQKEISPKGIAAAEAAAKKALEQKYPGMFNNVPKTKIAPTPKRGR